MMLLLAAGDDDDDDVNGYSCNTTNNDCAFSIMGCGYNYDSTSIRPRYDHSTTYVTTVGTGA